MLREFSADAGQPSAFVSAFVAVLGWVALLWLASCLLTFGPGNQCDACLRECGDKPNCKISCEMRRLCAPNEASGGAP